VPQARHGTYDRLRQNTVQEKLADLWLEHLVAKRRELVRV